MKEHLRMDKEERKANQVEMLREDMKDKMEHKELVLKMENKEARLEELEEETDKLNKSLEIEKNERSSLESELLEVRSSVEGRVKRATAMLNLEMETLKSELERTKLMLVGETNYSMEDKELLLKTEVETLKSELERTKLMLVGETNDNMEDKELLLKMEVETLKSELERTKLIL